MAAGDDEQTASVSDGRKFLVPIVLWTLLGLAALTYFVFPGIVMGLLARTVCLAPAKPTMREKRLVTLPFYPVVLMAEAFNPIGRFYEWQIDLVLKR